MNPSETQHIPIQKYCDAPNQTRYPKYLWRTMGWRRNGIHLIPLEFYYPSTARTQICAKGAVCITNADGAHASGADAVSESKPRQGISAIRSYTRFTHTQGTAAQARTGCRQHRVYHIACYRQLPTLGHGIFHWNRYRI